MIGRRIRAAIAVLRGRPFAIAFEWGPKGVIPTEGGRIVIPALTVPNDHEDLMLSVGTGDWLLDGKPFPWATIGPWVLTFGDDQATTIQVTFPVRMAGATALVGEDGPEDVRIAPNPDPLTAPECEGSQRLDDHDLIREWYTPRISTGDGEADQEPRGVRYLVGVHCSRCGWRPAIDATLEGDLEPVLAASRDA